MSRSTNREVDSEVWFRVVHLDQDAQSGAPVAPYRDQTRERVPRTPLVVELLRKAIEWQALLESGKIANQAEIAQREGVARTRVTQVLGLLRLAPEIREKILTSAGTFQRRPVTERMARPIGAIKEQSDQLREFNRFLG
jgi:hypothetical protein